MMIASGSFFTIFGVPVSCQSFMTTTTNKSRCKSFCFQRVDAHRQHCFVAIYFMQEAPMQQTLNKSPTYVYLKSSSCCSNFVTSWQPVEQKPTARQCV